VDVDALPHCWQPDCNGNKWFVDGRDIEAAQTVCCEECKHGRFANTRAEDAHCYVCYCGDRFEPRQP